MTCTETFRVVDPTGTDDITVTLTTQGELSAGAYAVAERLAHALAAVVADVQQLMDPLDPDGVKRGQ